MPREPSGQWRGRRSAISPSGLHWPLVGILTTNDHGRPDLGFLCTDQDAHHDVARLQSRSSDSSESRRRSDAALNSFRSSSDQESDQSILRFGVRVPLIAQPARIVPSPCPEAGVGRRPTTRLLSRLAAFPCPEPSIPANRPVRLPALDRVRIAANLSNFHLILRFVLE
jgi:hypothetical protein